MDIKIGDTVALIDDSMHNHESKNWINDDELFINDMLVVVDISNDEKINILSIKLKNKLYWHPISKFKKI